MVATNTVIGLLRPQTGGHYGRLELSRLPAIVDNRIQVDSFPGAKLAHATHILSPLHHKTTPAPHTEPNSFSAKSECEPRISQVPTQLLHLIAEDGEKLATLKYENDAPNLPPEEEQALSNLIRTRGLVIKPAVQLYWWIEQIMLQKLSDNYKIPNIIKNYQIPCTWKHTELIKQELKTLHSFREITTNQLTHLMGPTTSVLFFYLKNTKSWNKINDSQMDSTRTSYCFWLW